MNKKEQHESDRAIEMTARALGESNSDSSLVDKHQNSASQMEVEFEKVRELGRLIRDSNSHDTERWATPADAAQLKNLINAEFVSEKAEVAVNTSQMRLAALAATLLLMAGIGYVLLRSPQGEVSTISKLNVDDSVYEDSVAPVRFEDFAVGDQPNPEVALQPKVDDANSLRGILDALGGDAATSVEQKKAVEGIESGTTVGDFAANLVSDGPFDSQGRANAPALVIRETQPTGIVAAANPGFLPPPAEQSEGTTGQLPRIIDATTTTTFAVPDTGTVRLGVIGSAPLENNFLATADLDIPFSQDSFGAPPPQFFGYGNLTDGDSPNSGINGEPGIRLHVDVSERQSAEQYDLPPENQFLAPVAERALSTFSIDVDTASYANIRRFITNGQLPPGNAVRIEEMVNYFSYAYPQPDNGKPFSVSLDVAQCPWQPANKLVRVGIQGREIPRDNRPASNLVFLIDVSGSMSDENKLPLLQRSMLMLVDQLTENDRVSIVTYASDAGIRLQPTSGDQKQIIRDVINSLSSGGSTHGSAGIATAYELATRHFIEGGTNRVLLATDGDLNVGVTDDDALVQLIKSRAESGVFLSVLGFGTGNLKDGKLEKIADNGNGQYCYIDSIGEAQKVLVSEMSGSLVTIAKDVKLQIEFNPAEVAGYRLIGYENRALKNEDFANDRIDAGDIGAGHSVTAFYEIVPMRAVSTPAPVAPSGMRYQRSQVVAVEQLQSVDDESLTDAARSGELMYVALRFKQPESSESDLLEVTVMDSNQSFDAAPVDFKFAASVAAYGMKLRQSAYAGNWTWSDIENIAVATIGDDTQGHRAELVDLVRQTRKLLGR